MKYNFFLFQLSKNGTIWTHKSATFKALFNKFYFVNGEEIVV